MKRKIIVALIFCLCLLSLFCSCKQSGSEPLSAQEIAALRDDYAYLKEPELMSIRSIHEISELLNQGLTPRGFAAVTVTGEWVEVEQAISPAVGMPAESMTAMILPVHIDSMIFGNTEYSGSFDTYLWFGSSEVVTQPEVFQTGSKFVLSATYPNNPDRFSEYGIEEYISWVHLVIT